MYGYDCLNKKRLVVDGRWTASLPQRRQLAVSFADVWSRKSRRRTNIYAARVSYAADDAHRPPSPGFTAAARARRDARTDGRTRYRLDI